MSPSTGQLRWQADHIKFIPYIHICGVLLTVKAEAQLIRDVLAEIEKRGGAPLFFVE